MSPEGNTTGTEPIRMPSTAESSVAIGTSYDEWYEPDPPVMLGSAYSVSSDVWDSPAKPVGFIWPKRDPRAIVLATPTDIIKYGSGNE